MMQLTDEKEFVREAVANFATAEDLEAAIAELQSSGFDRAELSLLASEKAVEEKLGHRYRKVTELEDDPSVPRTHYVSEASIGAAQGALIGTPLYLAAVATYGAIVVSGGTLAAALGAAALAAGAGGLVGGVLAKLVGNHHAQHLQNELEHGGLLLWVRTWDAADEERAVAILKRHSGRDVHIHGG
jgi:hypothetical protein